MRVLMVSDVYYPRVNGVSTSIQTFRHDLLNQGHEVTLVAPEYSGAKPAGIADQGEVMRVPGRIVPFDAEDRIMYRSKLRQQLAELSHRGFDIVHVQTPFMAHLEGLRFARACGIPCVETYHTFFEEYFHHYLPILPSPWTKAVTRWVARKQCNELDGLVVPSYEMLQRLHHYGVETPACVIPTGLSVDAMPPGNGADFRTRHGISPTRPTLVHVGRLAFEKNIGFLLEMLVELRNRLPEVLLILSGEGPAREQLQNYVQEFNLAQHVYFVGYQERYGDLEDCYCAGDIFVFASRTETQGLVLLEAMSLGVPVVSLSYMGAAEILKPQRGAVIAEDDPKKFAATVCDLYQDDKRRQQLAEEGKVYAREWNSVSFASRLHEFYQRITHDRHPSNKSTLVTQGI